jgi:hypothetical protein
MQLISNIVSHGLMGYNRVVRSPDLARYERPFGIHIYTHLTCLGLDIHGWRGASRVNVPSPMELYATIWNHQRIHLHCSHPALKYHSMEGGSQKDATELRLLVPCLSAFDPNRKVAEQQCLPLLPFLRAILQETLCKSEQDEPLDESFSQDIIPC